jgi:hypothetical protein
MSNVPKQKSLSLRLRVSASPRLRGENSFSRRNQPSDHEIAQFLLYFCNNYVIFPAAIAMAQLRLGRSPSSKELSNPGNFRDLPAKITKHMEVRP